MKLKAAFFCFTFCLAFALAACSQSNTNKASQHGAEQAVSDAVDAYMYGYPLVTMDMTRKFATNYAKVQGDRGPMGNSSSFVLIQPLTTTRSLPALSSTIGERASCSRRRRKVPSNLDLSPPPLTPQHRGFL